jgi:LPS sulfotransferase NodH
MRPVIVLGMHRSGTSLTARLLRDLGIHMGSWLSRDAEAVFFQRLNRRIMKAAGTRSWGRIDPVVEAMQSPEFVAAQVGKTRRALVWDRHLVRHGRGIEQFFGPDLWPVVQEGSNIAWGWKDPRTALTFPVWREVFPQARFVHVLRNGVDVAISIHRRARRQQQKLSRRLLRLDYDPATLDFRYCFRLWETHVAFVFDHKGLIPPEQFYEIRFEDLLAEPELRLRELADFLDFPVGDDRLASVCRQTDSSRLDNSTYKAEYPDEIPALVAKPLMQQLGYG